MQISRRDLLRYSLTAAGSVAVSTAGTGCISPGRRVSLTSAAFTHGVASGDPLADSILLWTRATPADGQSSVTIAWELAEDPVFENPLRSGVAESSADRDFTVKVDVRDLEPGTEYFYRFRSADGRSEVGRTRTLPTGRVDSLRMAVFSCANYPAGYFTAYAQASRLQGIDVFLHLGDYFYEYGAGGYATERAAELGRGFPADNAGELYTLTDYRRRYALYRSDPDLQAMHAAAPMIAVWDDHEIANDSWQDGAQNHTPEEGDFALRRSAAVRAYFEWLPLRPVVPDAAGRIYRGFEFGDLLSLHMLDTRLIGRDRQLEYADFMGPESGALDVESFVAQLTAASRNLLGEQQFEWLADAVNRSGARWQVLGQQILMARMTVPAHLLGELFGQGDFAQVSDFIRELTEDKARLLRGEALPQDRQERLQQLLPYNLDAWDGYPAERERLYAMLKAAGKSVVVLAGDTHNAWYSHLRDGAGGLRGIELGTPGVSSPGMESYLHLDRDSAEQLAQALTVLIDELQYCQLHNRGFLEVEFEPEALTARWHFIDDVTLRDTASFSHTETYRL